MWNKRSFFWQKKRKKYNQLLILFIAAIKTVGNNSKFQRIKDK